MFSVILIIHQAGCRNLFCYPEDGTIAPAWGFFLAERPWFVFLWALWLPGLLSLPHLKSVHKNSAAELGEVWVQHRGTCRPMEKSPSGVLSQACGWTSCSCPEANSKSHVPLSSFNALWYSYVLPSLSLPFPQSWKTRLRNQGAAKEKWVSLTMTHVSVIAGQSHTTFYLLHERSNHCCCRTV